MSPGDLYRVHLERGKGSEQHGSRPVIVVQAAGAGGASTRLCVPTSSSATATSWRVQVEVAGQSTVALTEQVRALSVDRLTSPLGRLSSDDLRDVLARVHDLLPPV